MYYNTVTHEFITQAMLELGGVTNISQRGPDWVPVVQDVPEYDQDINTLGQATVTVIDGVAHVTYAVVALAEALQLQNLDALADKQYTLAKKLADDAIAPLLAAYSDVERASFDQQRTEIEAYHKDQSVATPVLDALAEQRGITREEQLQRTWSKVNAYFNESTRIIGKQQAYKDQIAHIVDKDATVEQKFAELRALTFTY